MPEKLTLPWGKDQVTLDLPEGWTVKASVEPESIPPVSDVSAEVVRSLAEPIGSERLGDRVHAGMKIAFGYGRRQRPTPVHLIYSHVLAELRAAASRMPMSPWFLLSGCTAAWPKKRFDSAWVSKPMRLCNSSTRLRQPRVHA